MLRTQGTKQETLARERIKMAKLQKKIAIENANIGWTNFGGAPTQYKPAGVHTFTIFLEDDIAHKLEDQGWNVRWRESKYDEDAEPFPTLEVTLSYNPNRPEFDPEVFRVCGNRMTKLDREALGILDRDCRQNMVENVDLGIRSYEWSRPDGTHGVKAYLDFIYVTVEQDPFAEKYGRYTMTEDDICGNEEVPF